MHGQFRIYDEQSLRRRLRIKPMQLAAIFIAGSVFGFSFSNNSPGGALAAADNPATSPFVVSPAPTSASSWCNNDKSQLRMSCGLGHYTR